MQNLQINMFYSFTIHKQVPEWLNSGKFEDTLSWPMLEVLHEEDYSPTKHVSFFN